MFGLTSQLRRAAISIPANIAEGFVKRGRGDKVRFMNISQGSLEECRYYLMLAQDLGFADTAALLAEIDEVSRMLNAYIRAVDTDRKRRLLSLLFCVPTSAFWLLASNLLCCILASGF